VADTADVARSILEAFDDEDDLRSELVEEPAGDPEPDTEEEEEDAEEEEESESEEEEEEAEGEDDGEATEEEVEEEARALGFDTDDPDVQAYLAQYQGDPLKALRAAAELRRAAGRLPMLRSPISLIGVDARK
jgi:hypothetical protein